VPYAAGCVGGLASSSRKALRPLLTMTLVCQYVKIQYALETIVLPSMVILLRDMPVGDAPRSAHPGPRIVADSLGLFSRLRIANATIFDYHGL